MTDFSDAIKRNPSVRTVWLDRSTVPQGRRWLDVLEEIVLFTKRIPGVRVVLYGPTTPFRFATVFKNPAIRTIVSGGARHASAHRSAGSDAPLAYRRFLLKERAAIDRALRVAGRSDEISVTKAPRRFTMVP